MDKLCKEADIKVLGCTFELNAQECDSQEKDRRSRNHRVRGRQSFEQMHRGTSQGTIVECVASS